MKVTTILPTALIVSTLFAPAAVCLQPIVFAGPTHLGEAADEGEQSGTYADGTRAINESRWADAETIFGNIAAQRGDRADAALYWKALHQRLRCNAYRDSRGQRTRNAVAGHVR